MRAPPDVFCRRLFKPWLGLAVMIGLVLPLFGPGIAQRRSGEARCYQTSHEAGNGQAGCCARAACAAESTTSGDECCGRAREWAHRRRTS